MTTGSYFGLIGMSMTMTMFCRQNGTGSLAEKCLIIVDVIPMSSAQFVEIAYLRSQRFSFSQFLCALVLENCTITIFLFSFSLKASLDQVHSHCSFFACDFLTGVSVRISGVIASQIKGDI